MTPNFISIKKKTALLPPPSSLLLLHYTFIFFNDVFLDELMCKLMYDFIRVSDDSSILVHRNYFVIISNYTK